MVEFDFGQGAALSPRMDFDFETPLLRGFQLGQANQQRKALAAAKKAEDEQKQINKLFEVNPKKVHPTLQQEVRNTMGNYFGYAMDESKPYYDRLRKQMETKQFLEDADALSTYRFSYDADKNRIKDPYIAATFANGNNQQTQNYLLNLEKKGRYTPTIDPYTTARAEKFDVKEDLTKAFGYGPNGENAAYYKELRKENLPEGGTRIVYDIDPIQKRKIIDTYYDRDTILPNLMYGIHSDELDKQQDIVSKEVAFAKATPNQIADEAAKRTLEKLLPRHQKDFGKRGDVRVSINMGGDEVDNISMSENTQVTPPGGYGQTGAPGDTKRPTDVGATVTQPLSMQFSTPYNTTVPVNDMIRSGNTGVKLSDKGKLGRSGAVDIKVGQVGLLPIATEQIVADNGRVLYEKGDIMRGDAWINDPKVKGKVKYEAIASGIASWNEEGIGKVQEPVTLLAKDVSSGGLDFKSEKEKDSYIRNLETMYKKQAELNKGLSGSAPAKPAQKGTNRTQGRGNVR